MESTASSLARLKISDGKERVLRPLKNETEVQFQDRIAVPRGEDVPIPDFQPTAANPIFSMSREERERLGIFITPHAPTSKPAKVVPPLQLHNMHADGQEAELLMRRGRWEYCKVRGAINGLPTLAGVMEAFSDMGRCLVRLATGRLVVCSKDWFVKDKEEKESKPTSAKRSLVSSAEVDALIFE